MIKLPKYTTPTYFCWYITDTATEIDVKEEYDYPDFDSCKAALVREPLFLRKGYEGYVCEFDSKTADLLRSTKIEKSNIN